MRTKILSTLLLCLAALSGCGNYVAACDYRQGSSNGPEPRCQELRSGLEAAAQQFLAACTIAEATPIDGECPRENLVAGCDEGPLPDGTSAIDWYYFSAYNTDGVTVVETRDDVDLMCNGEVVDP